MAKEQTRQLVTDLDCKRLQILLAAARASQPEIMAWLQTLQQLLETADVIPAEDVPPNVITMNSKVRLWNNDTAREVTLSLVFPADARGSDMDKVKLSVLTHLGMSILGRRVGDVVEDSIRIDRLLYQPEAAGHFDQ